eukprot:TRINITY_DN2938_c0_g5_i1.p1 TRINITY_DN2938_c0_g5~~TRINITY_DN2938_c0_g5_i1.p1  ORF type:complete len:160 (+),score=25.82 TRINITY_DN2938_c0_g5_i1:50-529(+)
MQPVAIAGLAGGAVGLFCLYKSVMRGGGEKDPLKAELYKLLPKEGDVDYREVSIQDICDHEFPEDNSELDAGAKRSWFLLYGVVFDLTDYIQEHPGGVEILLDQSRLLRDWASSADWSDLPDSDTEFEPYHDIGTMKQVAGLVGEEGERCKYIGHLVKQ